MTRKRSKAGVKAGNDEQEAVIEKSLTKKEVAAYKRTLLARLSQAEKGVNRVIPNTLASDPADLAAQETEVRQSLHEQEVSRREVIGIREALRKIETGDFGICEDCGEQIPRKRLDCQPMASCCIDCTKAREKKAQLQRTRGGKLTFSEI